MYNHGRTEYNIAPGFSVTQMLLTCNASERLSLSSYFMQTVLKNMKLIVYNLIQCNASISAVDFHACPIQWVICCGVGAGGWE